MKAMSYARYGGTEVLELTERPAPKVSPGSVLIRVRAAGVNPVDWKVMAGYLDPIMDVTFPVVPGWDVAGVVEAVGLDTPEFAVGDEVYSYGRRDTIHGGTFAEFVALPAGAVSRKPASLNWEQAAGLPLTGLTALRTLDGLQIRTGDTLLVHNGSGGVGRTAIQLAVQAGARVIATASAKNHERLRELGAEPVEYGDGLVARVRTLAPDGVDAVADFAGGVLEETLAVLKPDGRHASIADGSVNENGGRYVWVRPDARGLDRLSALADAGTLTVDVSASYPMEQAGAAFEASMSGHGGGKIVLTQFS
ncbi:alcohol dehydrogenase [Arthrobacter livingstonensis]|uniref:Alcohol dehydrogenase n=1 Tax=Arthrobacter livingstonensis TaxID=670078 RepID=A0A2V5LDJ4_9MICC|nr:NADP-dependent oxidoreductase [Arthrobacter livingstonensis]PYI69679.1 alcohol dehydrogenase [Arthrobacter livingstonensis]